MLNSHVVSYESAELFDSVVDHLAILERGALDGLTADRGYKRLVIRYLVISLTVERAEATNGQVAQVQGVCGQISIATAEAALISRSTAATATTIASSTTVTALNTGRGDHTPGTGFSHSAIIFGRNFNLFMFYFYLLYLSKYLSHGQPAV